MTAPLSPEQYIGRTAVDSDGQKVGKIGQIYLNDTSGQPEWLAISTGLFGTKQSFAPVYGATLDDEDVRLAVSKDLVKDAPQVEDDGHIEESETQALFQHYAAASGLGYGADVAAQSGYADATRSQGYDTSGPNTDDAITRSEERLNVGTQTVESGRARLRKYIVTENVQTTVPVSHEEVRIEREPITDANAGAAMSGAELSEEEHEVVLHEERPVVAKETVPVERVRLATETVTGEQDVSESVRKEQIEVEGDALNRTR